MPFRSTSQRRWMFANKPEMAAQWQAETPAGANLPEHVAQPPKRKKHGAPKMIGPAARRHW